MKLVTFLTLSMSVIFAAHTASVPSTDEESSTIGGVKTEENKVDDEITEKSDVNLQIDNTIEFQFNETVSLDDLWIENFETEYILMEIKNDQQLSEQVLKILRRPSKTAENFKNELQPILTTDQYEKIVIKAQPSKKNTPLDNNAFKDDNDTAHKSAASTSNLVPGGFSNDPVQQEELTEWSIYREYETTMQPKKHEIHSRKNPIEEVFDEILQQTDLIPENEKNLVDFVARHVANELIDVMENDESDAKTEIVSDSNTLSHLDHQTIPTQTVDLVENEIESQPEITSHSATSSHLDHQTTHIPTESVSYTIRNINKTLIDDLKGPVDQTWQGADYQVRFKRNSPNGDVELWWKKGKDDIYLHAFPNGAVDQNWSFGTVNIDLFRDEDGNLLQVWDFGSTKLEYIRDNNSPPPRRVWELGNSDEASYWKYRHLIKLWCNANDFFVGEKSCIIY